MHDSVCCYGYHLSMLSSHADPISPTRRVLPTLSVCVLNYSALMRIHIRKGCIDMIKICLYFVCMKLSFINDSSFDFLSI